MRVLVVEDDSSLADVLRRGLTEDGYAVDVCADGNTAVRLASSSAYDGIVLDVMLPGRNGFAVCRELRDRGVGTPILMLTARDTVEDTVEGFDAGADDYLRKPFDFREMRARLHSVIRRAPDTSAAAIRAGDLMLDVARREVRRGEQRIALTNREFQVLAFLMGRQGRVVTRIMIEQQVWGHDFPGFSNTVDVHIKRLRDKLDLPGDASIIETVRGAGYRVPAPQS
jgi:DNA-binding response OmpR family regulator